MDEQACPRCKTTKYRNPSLKLMVNICGHQLCESCVDLLFLKGSGSCPECNAPLRRSNFRVQLFDDPMVEKDINIRKRILRDYNKTEEDFETLEEYNNYLEDIENLIFNLCNDIDIINTNKKIEQYKRDNREVILRNKSKSNRAEYELDEMLEMERQIQENRRIELNQHETELKKKKIREKEAFIDELMFSHDDASKIVSTFNEQVEKIREEEKIIPAVKKPTEFSTGIAFTANNSQGFFPLPKIDDGPLFIHQIINLENYGPSIPPPADIEKFQYMKHIRNEKPEERAGGYRATVTLHRCLQEAFQSLFS